MNTTATVYERLGGEAAINIAVDTFYEKVLADPIVKDFFKNTDMKRQKDHQKKFMTTAFGGPKVYSGKTLRAAHQKMGLTEIHWNQIVTHLNDTLRELGVEEDIVQEVDTTLLTVKDDVLNK